MDLEPATEIGRELTSKLAAWMCKSPEIASDKLKRIFVLYSSKIIHDDSFLATLYGQGVVDEPPVEMVTKNTVRIFYVQNKFFSCTGIQFFLADEALQNGFIGSSTCARDQLGQKLCSSTYRSLGMQ